MQPRTLCARLTLSLLLILLPVLGGGGFFWFRGETRHLQAEFDMTLLALAYRAEALFTNSQQNELSGAVCDPLRPLSKHLSAHEGIALFSTGGELLCHVGSMPPQLTVLDRERTKAVLAGNKHFSTSDDGEELYRSLVLPILQQGHVSQILQVGNSNLGQQRRARHRAFTLFGLLVASGLSALLIGWFLVCRQLAPLGLLTQRIRELRNAKTDGSDLQIRGAAREIVELQEAIDDLVQGLNADLSRARQFTAEASHELRTPLTILRGETEVALRWTQDPDEISKVMVSNLEEIDRMSRLIEDLSLLSRSEISEMPLRVESLDLRELLEELCQQMQILGEQKGVAVSFEGSSRKVQIQGDPLRLRQLFLNLLSNAIKYTPTGGRVQLKIRMFDTYVEARVVDTGIGIEPQYLAQIFDRFYRVDKVRSCSDGGSGLGLSIARLVAESHGGEIRVCSTPGQGSEFTLILPCEQQRSGTSRTSSGSDQAG